MELKLDGKQVNICGLKYRIKMVDKVHRCLESPICESCGDDIYDTFGMIKEKSMTIEIAKDIDDQQKIVTLIHECMHAYQFMWTNERKLNMEEMCDFAAHVFTCFLKDNPWIATLFEKPKQIEAKPLIPKTNKKVPLMPWNTPKPIYKVGDFPNEDPYVTCKEPDPDWSQDAYQTTYKRISPEEDKNG